ncbi:ankyrin repeat domain-containing protein 65-like [Maniola jurtina]|uniref:ankyrin repeat domain-containing protein 65-like n=1 Tax=Maniola jurtina TaxID=191418 RepID=UPI001E68D7D8|nr:ankyrin repeat domain-containing protein 65-like [Maniola jurtina]
MSLQQSLVHHFCSWKPPPPAVEGRTSRDITLSFSAGLYSCLRNQLLYRVEKKEKIPPWVLVYCGGKTTKAIDKLAPCHPHRFRMRVLIKATAVATLAETLIQHYGDEKTVYELIGEAGRGDENDEKKGSKNESQKDKADGPTAGVTKHGSWLESAWSDETRTNTDTDGTSAVCLCMAVRCGYLKQVQQMLEERPLLISVINYNNGYTPLATAVRKGELGMVKYLVCAGAEVEQRSSTGQTPLHLAVLSANVAVAEFLLEKGADFQARDLNQLRVEHYAVDSCELDMVRFVMDRGGDVTVRDSNGWTPLFRAVCQGARTEVIKELVHRGSDVEAADKAQLTIAAAARLLQDRHGRRRESVLRLVDAQYQHGKVVASFTRLTKKISTFHNLMKQ